MELSISIFEGEKAIKTFTNQSYRLRMGTAEEIIKLIDIDEVDNLDEGGATEIIKTVVRAFGEFRPMIMDIFPDMTEEDYQKAHVIDVAKVVMDVVKYTFSELFSVAQSSKN